MSEIENPCKGCDRKETCKRPSLEGTDYTLVECGTVCEDYARYQGYLEGQSELATLRAERDTLRRALRIMAARGCRSDCPYMDTRASYGRTCKRTVAECAKAGSQWAISEAGEGR